MAKFCMKCGGALNPGSRFCPKCGAAVSASASQPHYTEPKTSARPAGKTSRKTAKEKKSSGGFGKFILFVLAAVLLFTGFINPGFIMEHFRKPKIESIGGTEITKPKTTSAPEKKKKLDETVSEPIVSGGTSKALAYTACAGVEITAPEGAFVQDTTLTVEPVAEVREKDARVMDELAGQGVFTIAAYEVNAGLGDDAVIPGTYTVSIDLNEIEVPKSLWNELSVYRVGENGDSYEYASYVENGKLIYSADQNSTVLIDVNALIYDEIVRFTYEKAKEALTEYYDSEFRGPVRYFYDTGKKEYRMEVNSEGGAYKIRWAGNDSNVDVSEVEKKLAAIRSSYQKRSNQVYEEYKLRTYEKAQYYTQRMTKLKSQIEVLNEAIAADPEYQRLQNLLKMPEDVQFASKCISNALNYLKNREGIKMPVNQIEFTCQDGTEPVVIHKRSIHDAWVEINPGTLHLGTQTEQDQFQINLAAELMRICMQGYDLAGEDLIKFEELLVANTKRWAEIRFWNDGVVNYEYESPDSSPKYLSTLKLGIDHYLPADGGSGAQIMKHEGAALAGFVEYLENKTNTTITPNKLLKYRLEQKSAGISDLLMKAADIPETEYETHYKNWARENRKYLGNEYSRNVREYNPNQEETIAKGDKIHVVVTPDSAYSMEIRGFKQADSSPMKLLLIPDADLIREQPDIQIVPVDNFKKFNKGAIIGKLEKSELSEKNSCRNILEIHGDVQGKDLKRTTGYTIYALEQTKPVEPDMDAKNVLLTLPANSRAAKDGLIDGYTLLVKTKDGASAQYDIPKTLFEKTVSINKEKLYEKLSAEDGDSLSFMLCEYVLSGEEKLHGESSETVWYGFEEAEPLPLIRFQGGWVSVEYEGSYKMDQPIMGLLYIEQNDEIWYYEGPGSTFGNTDSWEKLHYFSYDTKKNVLTIDFQKSLGRGGSAEFTISEDGHLIMKSGGETKEFFKWA